MANLSSFTPGDLVISVYGDGATGDPTNYTDNQASPIVLEELTTSGSAVGQLELPQTASTVNGVAQNAISGEYGSSSEGTLELSGDGQSLTIAGYGVNASTYNQGGAAVYGNAALAQSTSVPGGSSTAVARVIADIRYDGTVDTSTGAFNIDNYEQSAQRRRRNDGSSFYVAGQGVKWRQDAGPFCPAGRHHDLDADRHQQFATDMRTAEIYNGNLYVSTDSKQGPTSNIAEYNGLPTGAVDSDRSSPASTRPSRWALAKGNSINGSTGTVNLSPENYLLRKCDDPLCRRWRAAQSRRSRRWWSPEMDARRQRAMGSRLHACRPGSISRATRSPIPVPVGRARPASSASRVSSTRTAPFRSTPPTPPSATSIRPALYGITDTLAATTPDGGDRRDLQPRWLWLRPTRTSAAWPSRRKRRPAIAAARRFVWIRTTECSSMSKSSASVIGDLVVTSLRRAAPDQVDRPSHRRLPSAIQHPRETMPIRISAYAFGDEPARRAISSSRPVTPSASMWSTRC